MEFRQFIESLEAFNRFSKEDLEKLRHIADDSVYNAISTYLSWDGSRLTISWHPGAKFFKIDNARKQITPPPEFEYDPRNADLIEQLARTGLFDHYTVATETGPTTLRDLVAKIKRVSGSYETWANLRYAHRSARKRFAIKVIKEVHERKFYHATFKRYVKRIKTVGLRPSRTLDEIERELIQAGKIKPGEGIPLGMFPREGWSSLNPEKQRAVYLYIDFNKARSLAEYLSYRNGERTVVLEVDGAGVADYSKLVIDEDQMRSGGGAEISLKSPLPHFYGSVLGHYRSIGYKGTIAPQFIRVVDEANQIDYYNDDYD